VIRFACGKPRSPVPTNETSHVPQYALLRAIIRGIVFMAPSPGLGPQDVWQDVCLNIPKGVTPTQQIRVVIAYIEARLAQMHELFDWLAFEALRDAWPCK
jgi:Rap1a immunity proteins